MLLWDPKVPGDYREDSAYDASMFNAIFPDAYSGGQRSDKYPLSDDQLVILEQARILKAVRVGFIPIERMDELNQTPVLFITSATDTFSAEVEVQGNTQQAEMYPVNMRLILREPENATQETSNVIIASRIREGLGYVLDQHWFFNMKAERRGYDQDSVVYTASIAEGQNLEDIATPWEAIDYRFEVVFVEQKSLGSNQRSE